MSDEKLVQASELVNKRLHTILRHINGVREDANELARRLVAVGEIDFARNLIANAFDHDKSKLVGIEWEYLHDKEHANFALALRQHVTTNPHHPEYWGSISAMPRIYIAEMVCDWKCRANEFGTDLRKWIMDDATKRWKFDSRSKVAKDIKYFVDLILDAKFT